MVGCIVHRTCGDPNELELPATNAWSHGSRQVLPLVVVAIPANVWHDDYGTEHYCWIDQSSPAMYVSLNCLSITL